MAALVATPGMIDPAFDVEPGFLGNKENAAAMRAVRPPKIFGLEHGQRWSVACRVDDHSISSSGFRHLTRGKPARGLWHGRDGFVKLLWLGAILLEQTCAGEVGR